MFSSISLKNKQTKKKPLEIYLTHEDIPVVISYSVSEVRHSVPTVSNKPVRALQNIIFTVLTQYSYNLVKLENNLFKMNYSHWPNESIAL